MKFPRFFLNPTARLLYHDLQRERRANIRLRRERDEWRDKFLAKLNVTPLFTPPPKPVEPIERPPVGLVEKREYLARHKVNSSAVPSAEELLAMAERAQRNGG